MVQLQAPLQLPAGARLRVGRIGDLLLPWDTESTQLALPRAPMHENGDLIRAELTQGRFRCEWLQHAPFVPALSRADRDVPLLHAYLGIEGVLALLNDSLAPGGNGGGERRRWDKPRTSSSALGPVAPLGIESVLGSWMRDSESLLEIQRIVEIARQCKPVSEPEKKAYSQLQDFLQSWKAVERELIKR